mmetsp:Transcript_28096/g.47731  ORF Transcript_28096/g.47731 Transcript_28096/m.47731 type:complete len:222 (+) Transcript_28096:1967-2632(+)
MCLLFAGVLPLRVLLLPLLLFGLHLFALLHCDPVRAPHKHRLCHGLVGVLVFIVRDLHVLTAALFVLVLLVRLYPGHQLLVVLRLRLLPCLQERPPVRNLLVRLLHLGVLHLLRGHHALQLHALQHRLPLIIEFLCHLLSLRDSPPPPAFGIDVIVICLVCVPAPAGLPQPLDTGVTYWRPYRRRLRFGKRIQQRFVILVVRVLLRSPWGLPWPMAHTPLI